MAKKKLIRHGWNRTTQKAFCGVMINLKTMPKAYHPESDKRSINCKNCKKVLSTKKCLQENLK